MSGSLLSAAVVLPGDRVPTRGGRRAAARPDEDAVTLAAEAAERALAGAPQPAGLIFASLAPPYEEGGSAQLLVELLGLSAETFVADLCSTMRDGLAGLRLALALSAAGQGPVLVCAAHLRRSSGEGEAGDGAVVLLVGEDDGVARLFPGPVHAEELRDRWRLPGDAVPREGDSSFVEEHGGARLAHLVAAALGEREPVGVGAAGNKHGGPGAPVLVATASSRASARVERELGGPGDPAAARSGVLGTAHPLLRLVCDLDAGGAVVSAAGGLAEAIAFEPGDGAAEVAEQAREQVAGGIDVDSAVAPPSGAGFDPYTSGPRAWRERAQDLRLEGVRYGERIYYPPPAAPPPGCAGLAPTPARLARTGSVLTFTRDHVYPGGDVTVMAVVELDDGSRFYGQTVMGEAVEIGDRVRLVPRRLHAGGGAVQYFWKMAPWP